MQGIGSASGYARSISETIRALHATLTSTCTTPFLKVWQIIPRSFSTRSRFYVWDFPRQPDTLSCQRTLPIPLHASRTVLLTIRVPEVRRQVPNGSQQARVALRIASSRLPTAVQPPLHVLRVVHLSAPTGSPASLQASGRCQDRLARQPAGTTGVSEYAQSSITLPSHLPINLCYESIGIKCYRSP